MQSSNYSETSGSLWFYSKDEAPSFNADIANDNNFKSFKYKAKFLESPEADGVIGILKKCNNCFAIKREMSLIHCKVELKLKWTKY